MHKYIYFLVRANTISEGYTDFKGDDKCMVKVKLEFSQLFQELGQFEEDLVIPLKKDAKPFTQNVALTVAVEHLELLEKELNNSVKKVSSFR